MSRLPRDVVPTGDVVDRKKLLWNQEAAILDTTELICELMEEAGVSRAELAHRMGTTKSNITQMLDGSRNMTIRTVSDVFTHLGHVFRASCKARETARPADLEFHITATAKIRVTVPNAAPHAVPIEAYAQAPVLLNDMIPSSLTNLVSMGSVSHRDPGLTAV